MLKKHTKMFYWVSNKTNWKSTRTKEIPAPTAVQTQSLKKGHSAHLILITFLVLQCPDTIFIILTPFICDFLDLLPLGPLYSFHLLFHLFWISKQAFIFNNQIHWFIQFQIHTGGWTGQPPNFLWLWTIWSCFIPPSVSPWVHFLDPPVPWNVFPLTSAPMANLTRFPYNKNLCHDILHYDTIQFGRCIPILQTYSPSMLKQLYTQHWCTPPPH